MFLILSLNQRMLISNSNSLRLTRQGELSLSLLFSDYRFRIGYFGAIFAFLLLRLVCE